MDKAAQTTARAALQGFGLRDYSLALLESGDHLVLRVSTPGREFCLKVLAPKISEPRVRSQLEFMDHLREAGVPIAATVASPSGRDHLGVSTPTGERFALLYEWIDGGRPGSWSHSPWIGKAGELLGLLHEASRRFRPTGDFDARRWETVYAPAPGDWLDDFLARDLIDDRGREVVFRAAERTRKRFRPAPAPGDAYGIIHADFHPENLIRDGSRIWVLDFEEFGWGHFLLDITWPAVLAAKRRGSAGPFLEPFLQGYERRRPLSAEARDTLEDSLLASGIAALEMVHASSLPEDGPVARGWYEFLVSWLRERLG